MTIYVIVVTYNGCKWIDKCFGSLINSTIPVKILAIDNASTDGTPDIIKEKFPLVEAIETGRNLGFGKANNIGLKRVLDENTDYAFLLNQDAWVEEDAIEKLVEVHRQHPKFGILSPVPFDGLGKNLDRQFERFYSKPHDLNQINLYSPNIVPYNISFINAAGWLLPNSTIKKVGLFNDLFFQRGEDVNYAHRCEYHNIKIAFVSGCTYYHDRTDALNSSYTENQYLKSFENRLLTVLNNINLSFSAKLKSLYSTLYYFKKEIKLKWIDIIWVTLKLFPYIPLIFYKNSKHKKYYKKLQ